MTLTRAQSEPLREVIAKLQAWREHDYHADRQLADEVLIADGWQCEPDETFEGGVRWFWGTNPQYSASENTRPHPINDLNAAIGVVPLRASWTLAVDGESACGTVTLGGKLSIGDAPIASVALLIAALRAQL